MHTNKRPDDPFAHQRANAFETRRNNNSRFKQSYEDYVDMLLPKIWEIPDVRLSLGVRAIMAHREVVFLRKDIRETRSKIDHLLQRKKYLQGRSTKETLNKEDTAELSKISRSIKHLEHWITDLEVFKKQLEIL
jgi:hypothetical protein